MDTTSSSSLLVARRAVALLAADGIARWCTRGLVSSGYGHRYEMRRHRASLHRKSASQTREEKQQRAADDYRMGKMSKRETLTPDILHVLTSQVVRLRPLCEVKIF
jgi:hypothetical protein